LPERTARPGGQLICKVTLLPIAAEQHDFVQEEVVRSGLDWSGWPQFGPSAFRTGVTAVRSTTQRFIDESPTRGRFQFALLLNDR
jgi:hypothetical protein